jgi:poly(3-hydroxybutyrate) depolymerase
MTTPTITTAVPAAPAAWSSVFELGQVDVDGTLRDYALLRPDPLATDPVPLLLVFHGGGGSVGTIANQFGFTALSAPLPFLTVFPQGTDVSAGPGDDGVWNSGHGHVGATVAADDVAFIDRLLVDVAHRASSTDVRVDQSRTWASGFDPPHPRSAR